MNSHLANFLIQPSTAFPGHVAFPSELGLAILISHQDSASQTWPEPNLTEPNPRWELLFSESQVKLSIKANQDIAHN